MRINLLDIKLAAINKLFKDRKIRISLDKLSCLDILWNYEFEKIPEINCFENKVHLTYNKENIKYDLEFLFNEPGVVYYGKNLKPGETLKRKVL